MQQDEPRLFDIFADVFKCYYRKNSVRKFVYFILSTLTNYLDELDIP